MISKLRRCPLILLGSFLIFESLSAGVALAKENLSPGTDTNETFTGADGQPVNVVVHAPAPETARTVSLADPDVVSSANANYSAQGGSLDYWLFQAAVQKAKDEKASGLSVPPRVYDLRRPPSLGAAHPYLPHVSFTGLHDIVIDGQGSVLNFHDMAVGVLMTHDQRVLVRRFILDWVPPLAFGGTIVHDPAHHRTLLRLDPSATVGSPYRIDPNHPPVLNVLVDFDVARRQYPHTHEGVGISTNYVNSPVNKPHYAPELSQAQPTYILPAGPNYQKVPEGDRVLTTVRETNFGGALRVWPGSSDISLEDIVIYTSPGIGFGIFDADRGFRLTRCKVMRKPDTALSPGEPRRLISSLADAVNISRVQGNILIENGDFSLQADDGLNIHGSLLPINAVAGDAQMTVQVSDGGVYFSTQTADSVGLMDPATFQPEGTTQATVVAHHLSKPFTYTLSLNPPLSGLSQRSVLPILENFSRSGNNYIVRNCRFHDNLARGILVRTANGLIENNIVSGQTHVGIDVMMEYGTFHEGPGASNVVIQNNTISDVNVAVDKASLKTDFDAGLVVMGKTASGVSVDYPNQMLLIKNNHFSKLPGPAITITSGQKITLQGNTIEQANQVVRGRGSIVVTGASEITLTGNTRDANSTTQGFFVDPSTTKKVNLQTTSPISE